MDSPSSKSKKKPNYVFHAKIAKGYVMKVLVDVLSGPLARATFIVTNTGIIIREMDSASTVLFDVSIPRGNLQEYRCRRDINFSVNLKHTQKILKNVKKKDSVTFFIKENSGTEKLGVTILPEGFKKSQRYETNFVVFKEEVMDKIVNVPDMVYHDPVVMESSDFQKIKRLISNSKTLNIKMIQDKFLRFKCDSQDILGHKLCYGNKDDVEEGEDITYAEEFRSLSISYLVKVPGFSSQMQFSAPTNPSFPLKVTVNMTQTACTIGTIVIYMKHVKQIDFEHSMSERRLSSQTNEDQEYQNSQTELSQISSQKKKYQKVNESAKKPRGRKTKNISKPKKNENEKIKKPKNKTAENKEKEPEIGTVGRTKVRDF